MTATAAPEVTEVELVIGGMTCGACAARVQAKLNKVDGVTATVNLATERAHVTVPAHVSASNLVAPARGDRVLVPALAPRGGSWSAQQHSTSQHEPSQLQSPQHGHMAVTSFPVVMGLAGTRSRAAGRGRRDPA